MACERCGGFIVAEQLPEHLEADSSGKLEAIRCLNCGNLEDAVIRANRVGSRGPRRTARVAFGSRMAGAAGLIAEHPYEHAYRSSEEAFPTPPIAFESAEAEQCDSFAQSQGRHA